MPSEPTRPPNPYRPPATPPANAATGQATADRPGQAGTGRPAAQSLVHGPRPPDYVWGRRWPGPPRPATPAAAIAVLVIGVIAALSIPLDRAGVGWLVTSVAGTAALIVARRARYRPPAGVPAPLVLRPGPALRADRFAWSAATVALLGVGTVRAAGWLFGLCLATAFLTGTLAVAGGTSIRAMLLAVVMGPASAARSVPWVAGGLARVRTRSGRGSAVRIGATIVVSATLLAVFGALFTSADAAFAEVVRVGTPDVNGRTAVRWLFVFAATCAVVGGGAYLRAAPPDLSGLAGQGRRRVARLEWAVPLILLVLLFAAFVAIQLTVLFGGSRLVLETEGLTYAEYARSGFWQLLVVTGLTLVVIGAAARWAPRGTRTDRILIRSVLGALAGLTLVIVASALHRMNLYADTYGLTRLRVLVALCELWLGVVLLLVLVAGLRLRAGWLARVAVGAGVLALLGLAAANPDGLIADHNIDRYARIDRVDSGYLAGLSADAVPALDRLPAGPHDCVLNVIAADLAANPDDWRGWNYGRSRARADLSGPERPSPVACVFP